ncbi:MAG: ribonuclease III [Ruminococcaceae bacterium]|nr:ribonuclease III [Oscillospiraceae bacterium]MBQ8898906.1 ribonuclease III [Clostridia bacterium]
MATDPSKMNTGELAFVGDAVYSLLVRRELVTGEPMRISELHPASVKIVRAEAQAAAAELIAPELTEEENAIYTKGRNMKHGSYPKHSSHGDYARATGLECLFGWLYLCGRQERIDELYAVIRAARKNG